MNRREAIKTIAMAPMLHSTTDLCGLTAREMARLLRAKKRAKKDMDENK